MKYKIEYLPIADKDISAISDALTNYSDKAKRFFAEFEKKIKMLEDMLYMWPVYKYKLEYRRMILEDHLLFYIIDENERKIKIYRVLYDKMDIRKQII